MLGNLYVVATPIGNLEDITLRAIKILNDIDYILAEDTRVTSKLTSFYRLQVPIVSYHQHSSESKKYEILQLLIQGKNLAMVTDAGTPGISDPGNELIDFLLAHEPEIKIIPIPGPSAITAALSVCGFRADKFIFIGFLPKKKRTKLFSWLKEMKFTFAFYESPKRIIKTLQILEEYFGPDVRVFIARELTKIHETLYRGSLKEVREKLVGEIKGEIVVVIEV
jgi:16S rRNA (cytidine1402-2'-O)-methyltransferase